MIGTNARRWRNVAFGAAVPVFLGACAANTTEIQAEYVSPYKYEDLSCSQIEAEAQRISRKAMEVGTRVNKTAADDEAQTGIGIVLFWPALFFLEGKDTPDTREYGRLKGEFEALEDVSIKKDCGLKFESINPPHPNAASDG